jgi:hypothetical protein
MVQVSNPPSLIITTNTFFSNRLFYKENKSIEISCTTPIKNSIDTLDLVNVFTTASSILEKQSDLCSCIDYLISDSPTGRYYTCYSLNERSGQIDELKLCIDNIPSFKQNFKKIINYSNILLKRLQSINHLTNYLTCSNLADKNAKFNISQTNEIKTQSVIPNVGHFKLFYNNTIFIQFIDKIKLYADGECIKVFNVNNNNTECFCTIVLPDQSQHEINFANNLNKTFFGKYIDFLIQWLKWLFPEKFEVLKNKEEEDIDINSIKYHVNRLKLFNFTIDQELHYNDLTDRSNDLATNNTSVYDYNAINDVLKANSDFLKNISKND